MAATHLSAIAINFDNYGRLRSGLKKIDEAASRELQTALKSIGKEVAQSAKGFAPHGKSGKLGSMISPSVTNQSLAIVSNAKTTTKQVGQKRSSKHPSKYPNPYYYGLRFEYGGRGTGKVGPRAFLAPAFESSRDDIEGKMLAAIDAALTTAGFE